MGVVSPHTQTSLPGYSGFHSNLGIQEIVEVGSPFREKVLSDSMDSFSIIEKGSSIGDSQGYSTKTKQDKKSNAIEISGSAGLRSYMTNNVLRSASEFQESSGVLESNLGLALTGKLIQATDYFTLLPRLDLMTQWANYQEQSELLDYRFALAKFGLAVGFPRDWSVGLSWDYNSLSNMESGEETFHAHSPSVSLQKIIPTSESAFVMLDSMLRYSYNNQSVTLPALGIYADSGNTLQSSFSATYLLSFDNQGRWILMPRMAINRTYYDKEPNLGRIDYHFSGGISLMFQWTDWLGAQSFLNYAKMSSESIPDFEAWDFGFALSGNYRF